MSKTNKEIFFHGSKNKDSSASLRMT